MATIRQGLTRSSRLRCSENFKQIFQQGRRMRQGCLTTYTQSNNLGYARLGLAITKKAVLRAAARNRVKRVIRESFRLNQAFLCSIDIVITVTNQCISTKQILLYDLTKQWSKLVLYYKVV